MIAKYRTACSVCQGTIPRGGAIEKLYTNRWAHADCAARAAAARIERLAIEGDRYNYRGRA